MLVPCAACSSGTGSDGNPCIICNGDGELNLLDANFPKLTQERRIQGIVWDTMLTNLASIIAEQASQRVALTSAFADINDKLNDVMDKCNDIFEKVSE